MPVHWPCLLLMGCLHWLGKWWLDGQVTLLGMMEHLSFLFVLSFALLFILSCQDAVQSFLEYVNSRGLVLFFSGLLVQFLVPIFQWHWSAVKFALSRWQLRLFLLLRRWHFGDSTNRALDYILSTLHCFWSQYRDVKENTPRCHLSVIDKNGSADRASVRNPQ